MLHRKISSVIRESLMTVDDPDRGDIKHILAVVRARWAQLGGKPEDIKDQQIYQVRMQVRRRHGKITKETIAKYHKQAAERMKRGNDRNGHANGAVLATLPRVTVLPKMTTSPEEKPLTVEGLRQSWKDFCQAVGGTDNALALVELVKESRQ